MESQKKDGQKISIVFSCCSTFAAVLERAQGFATRGVLAQTAVPARCNGKTEKGCGVFAQTALPARCNGQTEKKRKALLTAARLPQFGHAAGSLQLD